MAGTPCKDHLGNEFESIAAMCKHWNIAETTFKQRMTKHMTIEEALTQKRNTKSTAKKCTDHLGNTFNSIKQMCQYYNIPQRTYINRINAGLTTEEALTKKLSGKIQVTDHLGNTFESINAMCRHYKIQEKTFRDRIQNHGYTLEDALTLNINQKNKSKKSIDHLGCEFVSKTQMLKYWNMPRHIFDYRILTLGWSLSQSLTTIHTPTNICELSVIRLLESRFYEVKFNNETDIWTHDEIMEYYRSVHNVPIPINILQKGA